MARVIIHRDFPGEYAHAQDESCWCLPVVSDAVMDERPQAEILAEANRADDSPRTVSTIEYPMHYGQETS